MLGVSQCINMIRVWKSAHTEVFRSPVETPARRQWYWRLQSHQGQNSAPPSFGSLSLLPSSGSSCGSLSAFAQGLLPPKSKAERFAPDCPGPRSDSHLFTAYLKVNDMRP